MLRMRNVDNVAIVLRGKRVEAIKNTGPIRRIKLLEDAGQFRAGDTLSCFRSQIEEIDEATGTTRFYDSELAEALDAKLNQPYEPQDMPCKNDACSNDSGFNYELTGYIHSDESGVYVVKKCTLCGAETTDGDGDFHSYYRIDGNGVADLDEDEENRVALRSTHATDIRLFSLFDSGNEAELGTELYALLDSHVAKNGTAITDDQRDFVVQRTMKDIDEASMSIEASLWDHLASLDDVLGDV